MSNIWIFFPKILAPSLAASIPKKVLRRYFQGPGGAIHAKFGGGPSKSLGAKPEQTNKQANRHLTVLQIQ